MENKQIEALEKLIQIKNETIKELEKQIEILKNQVIPFAQPQINYCPSNTLKSINTPTTGPYNPNDITISFKGNETLDPTKATPPTSGNVWLTHTFNVSD